MKCKQIANICIALLLINGALVSGASAKSEYTAETLIRVLPYADKDPMSLETPVIDKELQYEFRVSIANLFNRQQMLEKLLDSPVIRETKWFSGFSDEEDIRMGGAIKDLENRFGAFAQKESEFIVVSMRCEEPEESAFILNEMVRLFLAEMSMRKKEEISQRLAELARQQERIQRDLDVAERALIDVCATYGYSDLGEHGWPHPIEVRLNRLWQLEDDCSLELQVLQARISNLERQLEKAANDEEKNEVQANLTVAKDDLVILAKKFEKLVEMRKEAERQKKDLDLARATYKERAYMRDEIRERLGDVQTLIGKLRIMREDPEAAKVMLVEPAAVPLKSD